MQEIEEGQAREIAAEFLLGEILKVATKQIRAMSVPFAAMREGEQSAVLLRMADDIRSIVGEAIDVISSNARITFRAGVDQVVFKDGVKATLSMARGDNAHALADIAGGFVTVVIEDRSALLDAGDAVNGDADQKPLFDAILDGVGLERVSVDFRGANMRAGR